MTAPAVEVTYLTAGQWRSGGVTITRQVDEPAVTSGWRALSPHLGSRLCHREKVTAISDTVVPTPAQAQPVIVMLPAELDVTNSNSARGQLDLALASGAPVVVADMTATAFCDSQGIGVLVMAHKRARAHGAELRVVAASPGVLRIMRITGLDTVLRTYPSLSEALNGHVG